MLGTIKMTPKLQWLTTVEVSFPFVSPVELGCQGCTPHGYAGAHVAFIECV